MADSGSSGSKSDFFHWADYTLFALSLASTLCIGLVFAVKDRWHKQTAESYLMGDRDMSVIGVAPSIAASTLNAAILLGSVAEAYYTGLTPYTLVFGVWLGCILIVVFVIPKYRNMNFQMTSVFEYLERRFNLLLRMVASGVYVLLMGGMVLLCKWSVLFFQLLYLSIVLFAPSLALAQVSHMQNIFVNIALTGTICTIYTAFGGIKAVVWTDAFQMVILLACMLSLAVMGSSNVGGLSQAWQVVKQGGRDNIFVTTFDLHSKYTVWNNTIGHGITYLALSGTNQMIIQRLLAVKSTRKAQLSMIGSSVVFTLMVVLMAIVAVLVYATFADCDPLGSGRIKRFDQILPMFIMQTMGHLHGIPGLFIAGIYAAALSTVSSAINSLAAVALEDFVRPAYEWKKGHRMSDQMRGWMSRVLGIAFGVLSLLLTLMAPLINRVLMTLTISSLGLMSGPLFGIFCLGLLFPCANATGALFGLVSSLSFGLYMFFGATLYKTGAGAHRLPTTVAGCLPAVNFTLPTPRPEPQPTLYDTSFTWYSTILCCICIVLGLIASLITRFINRKCCGGTSEASVKVDNSLLCSVADDCCCFCPSKLKAMMTSSRSDSKEDAPADQGENVKLPLVDTESAVHHQGKDTARPAPQSTLEGGESLTALSANTQLA